MATVSSSSFLKTNWLNSHRSQFSKLARNYHKTIIGDSIAAALNWYQNVWVKSLQPLKILNYGIGGDNFQYVLWRAHNIPVVKSVKKIVVLCGKNNQGLPEDMTHSIIEVASTFKSKYGSISIFICDILPHEYSWSVNRACIEEVNHFLKATCSQLFFNFIYLVRRWTLSNGSFELDLLYLDNVYLV